MGDWKKRTNRAAQIGNLVEREEEGGGGGDKGKGKMGEAEESGRGFKTQKGAVVGGRVSQSQSRLERGYFERKVGNAPVWCPLLIVLCCRILCSVKSGQGSVTSR